MGIKRRVLIFAILFGISSGSALIIFNQLMLKNSLISIQEQQTTISVKLGQQKINNLIQEMEFAARKLALFSSDIYTLYQDNPNMDIKKVFKRHLLRTFERHLQSIGMGVWFEPKALEKETSRFGPYVYKDGEKRIYTWDLSSEAYNYHAHEWYRIAFESERLNDTKAYWSEPYYDATGTDELMLTVTVPILDTQGRKVGVSTVDWAIKHLTDVIQRLEFTENASAFLIDKEAAIFLSFPDALELNLQPISETHWARSLLEQDNNTDIAKRKGVEFNSLQGSVYYLQTKENFILGIFLPDKDYMHYIDRFTSNNLILNITLFGVFVLGIIFILKAFYSPLRLLIDEISASVSVDEASNSIQVKHINDVGVKEFLPIVRMLNRVYDQITGYTQQIEHKNFRLVEQQKEINELNTNLEQKVEERTQELQATQQQMIEMEKNAALGQLVAGVAHEMNTPLGVCVTASSILKEKHTSIQRELDNETLTKSNLMNFLYEVKEVSGILDFNLDRASDLIKSFKQVSTDQSIEELREFNLAEYLGLIIGSLKPAIKKANIQLELSVPEDISINSYPGIFSQIITNLISNSINHAFEHRDNRRIHIQVEERDNNMLSLRYTDNGNGMSHEVRDRIFEPFFTTRRGQGGIGLGMHITYNLITQTLKGSISVESEPSCGTSFSILLPMN